MTSKHQWTPALLLLPILWLSSTGEAHAKNSANCEILYTRTACPGQQAESYKKCGGKQFCVKHLTVATPEECRQAAIQSCSNSRLTVTKSKVIGARFNGKPIKSKTGMPDMCLDYSKRATEFNQCGGG